MSAIRVLASVPTSPLSRLVEDYLVHCRARGLSPRTVEISYGYALRSVFLPWSAEQGVTRVEELDSSTAAPSTASPPTSCHERAPEAGRSRSTASTPTSAASGSS